MKTLCMVCLMLGGPLTNTFSQLPARSDKPVDQQQDHSVLSNFVRAPDSTFSWTLIQRIDTDKGSFLQLSLQSQTWREIPWKHQLYVFFPAFSSTQTGFITLQMDFGAEQAFAGLQQAAQATGVPVAILGDVPNQPLFNGKQEEELLNYTFEQFLQTNDSSWPLLLPMVKATVRAMDVLQAVSQRYGFPMLNQFVVAGHSKRGHTAWLTAAVDGRVAGLIAQGFNTLHSSAQIAHYFATYGALDQSALAAKEVIERINTPAGQRLLRIVDAYTYRQQLTMPKLVIVGTNDDYTPVDALNMYWPGLVGPKSILSLPNTGHVGANDDARLFPTAYSFIKAVAQNKPLPIVESELQPTRKGLRLVITTDKSAISVRIWIAHSATRDFRQSQWVPTEPLRLAKPTRSDNRRRYRINLDKPLSGYQAIIGEVAFNQSASRFLLSTVPYVVKSR